MKVDKLPVQDTISLEIQLRVLKTVTGTYLNPENCSNIDALNLDEVPIEQKSSQFWIQYTDHMGETICTEKKAWIDHFQVDKEAGLGKCDFKYTLRFEEIPSLQLREWFRGNLFLHLYESKPLLNKKPVDGSEDYISEVVLEDGAPKVVTNCIGVSISL